MNVSELLTMHVGNARKSMSQAEALMFYAIIRNSRARSVLESGTYIGMSAMWGAAALKENHDQWYKDEDQGLFYTYDIIEDRPMIFYGKDLEPGISYAVKPFEEAVTQVVGTAPHPWVVFVDGAIGYDHAKGCYDAVDSHLEPGDIVLFHDMNEIQNPHSRAKFAKEIGVIEFEATFGLGVYQRT